MQEQSIGVAKLKAEFSSILTKVQNGEEFVIEYGKNHKKAAKIVAYLDLEPKSKRQFGQLKDRVIIDDISFNDSIESLIDDKDDIIYT